MVEPRRRARVALLALFGKAGGENIGAAPQLIEGEDEIVKAEMKGLLLFVQMVRRAQPVEFPAKFIRNCTDGAALERRQVRVKLEPVFAEQIAQGRERRHPHGCAVPGRIAPGGGKYAEGLDAYEGIAAELGIKERAVKKSKAWPIGHALGNLERVAPFELVA